MTGDEGLSDSVHAASYCLCYCRVSVPYPAPRRRPPCVADGSTGEQVWSFNANKTGVATWGPDIAIGVKGQSAYFVVQDKLTAVDTATGKETWHFEVGDTEIFHTLTVGETGVIFVTALEHVYAIDPADGQQIWNVTFKSNFRGAAIAVDGTTRLAYFGSVGCTAVTATESCTIVGLDQATGRQLTETNALGNVGDLFLFPLASGKGGSLFIRRRPQGNQTQLDCIAADGALSWTFSCPSGTGVEGFVTESDFIIVGCSGGSIHGLETRRGVEKWNVSDLYGSKVVAMAGPSTVLFSGANHFAAMDIEGLQPLWNCTTPGDATQYLAALGDKGRMYIPSYVRNDFVTLYGAAGHTTSRVKHKMLAIILAVSAAVGVTSFVLFATYFYRKRRHRYRVIQ